MATVSHVELVSHKVLLVIKTMVFEIGLRSYIGFYAFIAQVKSNIKHFYNPLSIFE